MAARIAPVLPRRCAWAEANPQQARYHDTEWGVPSRDDRHLFEMLILEGAQAGLSWLTILRKRGNYRKAFDGFDPEKIARYNKRKIESLLKNEGIIRNRLKIEATISNARAFAWKMYRYSSMYLLFIFGALVADALIGKTAL